MWRLIIGVIGLALVYSVRPPSGMGEAFMMLGQGRNWYLKEPIYLTLMVAFGLLALFGLISLITKRNPQIPPPQQ
jgi:hypothetical protein